MNDQQQLASIIKAMLTQIEMLADEVTMDPKYWLSKCDAYQQGKALLDKVNCWNSHDELVQAAQSALIALNNPESTTWRLTAIANIESALAKGGTV